MAKLEDIKLTPEKGLDPTLLALCRSVKAKRPLTVINHILKYGIITNDDLNDLYKYDHPPRAIRDVRENGIPLITYHVTSPKTGRRMGAYTFDDISKIKHGRIGGRKAFSKRFKQELIETYGARDAFTHEKLHERYLQIDHRIPYEIAGDIPAASEQLKTEDYMLIDASSNRAKSWSCEHCDNFQTKHDAEICNKCFWASPENYEHVAETPSRRVEIIWSGAETAYYDMLKKEAEELSIDLPSLIKNKLSQ